MIDMIIFIGIYLTITTINLIFYHSFKKENSLGIIIGETNEDRDFIIFMSLMPIVNILALINVIVVLIPAIIGKLNEKKEKLIELNTFIQCNSCDVVYRNGYKKEDICPICKKKTSHEIIEYESFKSSKIPEHVKFKNKNLKEAKNNKVNDVKKENELLYEKTKEKALAKKKTVS